MSNPSPFVRYRTEGQESEIVPLATETSNWLEERDLGDERLPTYGEAIAADKPTRPPNPAVFEAITPYQAGTIPESRSQRRRFRRRDRQGTASLRILSPCMLGPMLALSLVATIRFLAFLEVG